MPTPEQVHLAVETMKKLKVNHQYFFEKNPPVEWIEPLREAGYFKRPPLPEDREGMRWFPRWPDSEYLARIAPKAPDLVFDVLRALPSTDNIYVHGDLVTAAKQLNAEQAAQLALKELAWIEKPP